MLAQLSVAFGVALQLLGKCFTRVQDPDRGDACAGSELKDPLLQASGGSISSRLLLTNVPDEEELAAGRRQQPLGKWLNPSHFGALVVHLQDV